MTTRPTEPWPESTDDDDAFIALVDRFLCDDATPADAAELSEALRAAPTRLALYAALSTQHQHLHESHTPDTAPGTAPGATPLKPGDRIPGHAPAQDSPTPLPIYRKGCEPQPSRFRPHHYALAIAAALLFACGVAVYVVSLDAEPSAPDPASAPIATLIDVTGGGTVMVNDDITNPGDDYARGSYALDAGTAQFMLNNNVTVNMHGRTRLTLHGNMRAALDRGGASFVCPPRSKGYTVTAPGLTVVDLGTAFRVHVDDDGISSVAVTEGRVLATHHATGRTVELEADQWVRFDINGGALAEPADGATLLNRNLVVNGDFESGPHNGIHADKPTDVDIEGWVDTNTATVVEYGFKTVNGYPNPATEPVPDDRGDRYYIGVVAGTIHQVIELEDLATAIDAGLVRGDLSAWLGGYSGQNDRASVVARFLDAEGNELTSATIGPISASDRAAAFGHRPDGNPITGFIETESDFDCPPLTRRVRIELITHPGHGLVDAYVDNIALTLRLDTESKNETPRNTSPDDPAGAAQTR